VWRAPLVAAAGLTGHVLAAQAGLPWAGLVGLVAAAQVGWRLRFRLSEQTLERVRWVAEAVGRLLGTHTTPLVCVHGAHVHGGGLHGQGVAIVPASLLRSALGDDRVLSDADVERLATTAWTRLHPAA
jgi:hypothetical protein